MKVSFVRGVLVLTFIRISIRQPLWVGEKTNEGNFWRFFISFLSRGDLILVVSLLNWNPIRPPAPPPPLSLDPISSDHRTPDHPCKVSESLTKDITLSVRFLAVTVKQSLVKWSWGLVCMQIMLTFKKNWHISKYIVCSLQKLQKDGYPFNVDQCKATARRWLA